MPEGQTNIYVIIPAYNEGSVIGGVIKQVAASGFTNIIVIDDGSSDNTYSESSQAGAIALRHRINRGKGAAVKTGIEAALRLGAQIIVTMDGDGQHDPYDISKLVNPIASGHCDVSLGIRPFHSRAMPPHKIIANHIANGVAWAFYGLFVSDSQSGFRAYSHKAAQLIDTRSDRYEYDSAVLQQLRRHRLSYLEVPIDVKYTPYSSTKLHRQNLTNGLKTLYKMVWSRIA